MKIARKLDHSFVKQPIKKGVEYLLSHNNNGRWKGFPTLAGESDIWVTGFVVAHMQSFCDKQDAFKDAHKFLLASRQSTRGWSYSAIVPSDADSTAWSLMALNPSPEFDPIEMEKSLAYLWSHFEGPGISTYNIDSGIGQFIAAPNNDAIAGWTSSHPDVSVAAILADAHNEHVSGILDWLQSLQSEEGFINSYWWRGPFYTTALMLRAMSNRNEALPKAQAEKLLNGLKKMQLDDGGFALETGTTLNPFSTALALEIFLYLSDIGAYNETINCANALLKAQNDDGSWDGDFILRIPAPHVVNPETIAAYDNPDGGGNSFIPDQNGLFATTMACYALDSFQQRFDLPN